MADIFEPRFLLASFHIEAVLRGTTIAGRRKTLKSIKEARLGDVYGATLERIKAQDEEKTKLAMATLTWVCHSERPLRVDELSHALAVEIGATDFDPENVPSIGTLLDCCQGLIMVDAEASTIRLIHYTVKEYLCSHPGLFSKPHSLLAETCLTYLSLQQVKCLTRHSLPHSESTPFLKYCARYWGTHTSKDLSENVRALALQLLNRYEDHISAVSLLEQIVPPTDIGALPTSPLFSGLHCASWFGIVELVTVLINAETYELNQQDCRGKTPLAWAARNGHERVVEALLQRKNVDPNPLDVYSRTPLGCAAMEEHEGVVKLLLEREDVDPNRPDKYGQTPLGWAAMAGCEGVVKLLLERKHVDPNRQDKEDETALGHAAIKGHEGVVRLLLQREDVDLNRPDKNDRAPLGCAAVEGHEGVVKLLLERETVDPNRPDKNDRTPLVLAAMEGREGVVKLLLEREDIDPNRPDSVDVTPLGWAAMKGHEAIVKLLLEREDLDPNCPDNYDRTPLGYAAFNGHEGVVRLFLEREDVDPYHPDKYDRTPLGLAAMEGHEGVAKLLQERQDVGSHHLDQHHGAPLSHAPRDGPRIVPLLQPWISVVTLGAGGMREGRWDAFKRLPPFFPKKKS